MAANFQWDLNDDGQRQLLEKLGDRVHERTPLRFLCTKRLTNSDLKDHYNRFVFHSARVRNNIFPCLTQHFNRLHSSLRNVIERSFGVLKARFPIFKRMAHYPFLIQRSIVVAAMAMHNFIRKEDTEDQLFAQFSSEDTHVESGTDFGEDLGENTYTFDIIDMIEMDAKRNSIADAIWNDASS